MTRYFSWPGESNINIKSKYRRRKSKTSKTEMLFGENGKRKSSPEEGSLVNISDIPNCLLYHTVLCAVRLEWEKPTK